MQDQQWNNLLSELEPLSFNLSFVDSSRTLCICHTAGKQDYEVTVYNQKDKLIKGPYWSSFVSSITFAIDYSSNWDYINFACVDGRDFRYDGTMAANYYWRYCLLRFLRKVPAEPEEPEDEDEEDEE